MSTQKKNKRGWKFHPLSIYIHLKFLAINFKVEYIANFCHFTTIPLLDMPRITELTSAIALSVDTIQIKYRSNH